MVGMYYMLGDDDAVAAAAADGGANGVHALEQMVSGNNKKSFVVNI